MYSLNNPAKVNQGITIPVLKKCFEEKNQDEAFIWAFKSFKDTHRENTLSDKTETLTKSMNIYILAISILNQLFIRGSYTQIKFSKNEVVSG